MRRLTRSITSIILVVALIAAAVIFIPRLAHTCDNCKTFFVGTGYYANILSNAISTISGEANKVLCRECAATEHALAIATGTPLEDFQRPLFETAD